VQEHVVVDRVLRVGIVGAAQVQHPFTGTHLFYQVYSLNKLHKKRQAFYLLNTCLIRSFSSPVTKFKNQRTKQ